MATQPKPQQASVKATLTTIFVIIALIYGCNQLLCSDEKKSASENYTDIQRDSANKADFISKYESSAYSTSQQFLNDRLKSPSTAEYPTDWDRNMVEYMGDSVFYIKSYVDSQNGFGATIRTKYWARLKLVPGDKWNLISIKLDE